MTIVEFIVVGTPVSYQTKNRASLQIWKAQVRAEAGKVWTQAPMKGRLKCTIMNFFQSADTLLDDDNMAKRVRDAMTGLVYDDDSQIRHTEHSQTSIGDYFQVQGSSKRVVDAIREGKGFVYVRVEDAPTHTQLPK